MEKGKCPQAAGNRGRMSCNRTDNYGNDFALSLDNEMVLTENNSGTSEWKCQFCGKTYKSQTWFTKHMNKYHNDGISTGAVASVTSDSPTGCGQIHNHMSPNQEFHHLRKDRDPSIDIVIKPRLMIASTKEATWQEHNENLRTLLALKFNKITKENSSSELDVFDDAVYDYFKSIYPPKDQGRNTARKTKENSFKARLRKQKRELKKKLRAAKAVGDASLVHSLARGFRSILKLIQEVSKVDEGRSSLLRRGSQNAEFDKNPYMFAKKVLKPSIGEVCISKEEAEVFYTKLYNDRNREEEYCLQDDMQIPLATMPFNENAPTKAELKEILKKKSNGSAPGPNGIPYIIYKKCPILVEYLHKFYCVLWSSGFIPPAFAGAVIILLPKKSPCQEPEDTRPIALTNTHSKVFFSILGSRINKFMEINKFSDRTVQKGFCEGLAGCLEHNELLAAALEDARRNERQIVVCWLDLKNAFGSIRHNLLQTALKGFNIPVKIRKLLFNYYDQLVFSIVNRNWKTKVMSFEIGLFQGCCLSPALFKLVFSLLERKLLSGNAKGYKFKSNRETPPVLTFVDDTTLVSSKVEVVKKLLQVMENFCQWTSCLQMKPSKCYTLALARIKSKFKEYDPCLMVHGEKIQVIQEGTPFKFLGRHLDFKGRDAGVTSWKVLFLSFLQKVEDLLIMGPKKAWIYQHVLLGHLTWAFLLYDFPKSALQELERESVKLLKKWFLLSRSADPSILFRPTQNFGLGISNVAVRYKQLRCVKHCLLKKSEDDTVSHLADDGSAKEIEARAVFSQMFINGANPGRAGLGWSTNEESQGDIMKRIVLDDYVQEREVHAIQLKMQNDWVCVGDFCIPPRLAWKSIMYDWSPALLKFYLNSFQSTLPDPSNLKRWGKLSEEENVCQLCKNIPCTARHILSGCKIALEEGRYTFRHDKVLRIIREAVSLSIAQSKKFRKTTSVSQVSFVKQGEKIKKIQKTTLPYSCLSAARDWQILMDIGNDHYIFPAELYTTTQCPDILAFSVESKQVLLVELTVPWEENIPNQHLEKTRRYEELVLGLKMRGFRTNLFAVEVGARGLPGKSMHHLLKSLGLSRKLRNKYIERMSKAAAEASFFIWLSRGRQWGRCEVSVEAS